MTDPSTDALTAKVRAGQELTPEQRDERHALAQVRKDAGDSLAAIAAALRSAGWGDLSRERVRQILADGPGGEPGWTPRYRLTRDARVLREKLDRWESRADTPARARRLGMYRDELRTVEEKLAALG